MPTFFALNKKQLKESGDLERVNTLVKKSICKVDSCGKSYRSEIGYEKHMQTKHPELYKRSNQFRMLPKDIENCAPETNSSIPTTSLEANCQPVNNIVSERNDNESDRWATAWSIPRQRLSGCIPETNSSIPTTSLEANCQPVNNIVSERNDNESDRWATAWSIARQGFSDTICEQFEKLIRLRQDFQRASKRSSLNDNLNLPTFVTQTSFRRVIGLMADDIKKQLLERINKSPFYSLYIGETVDIQSYSYLIVIVRYINKKKIIEDLFHSQKLNFQTAQNEIFAIVDTIVQSNRLDWRKCVNISIDGSRAKAEPLLKFLEGTANKQLPLLKSTFTLTRRHDFIKNNISSNLKIVLADIIKLVNTFKTDCDVKLAEKFDLKFKNLFFKTEDYWVSYGHQACDVMFQLAQHRQVPVDKLRQLAFLIDIMDHINELNKKLQNVDATIFDIYDDISAMYDKLGTYKTEIRNNNLSGFQNLHYIFEHYGCDPNDVRSDMKSYGKCLKQIQNNLMEYLPVPKNEYAKYKWIRNPFDVEDPEMLTTHNEISEWKQLTKYKRNFNPRKLEEFWIEARTKYPNLSEKALQFLLIFRSSQFYEKAFAAYVDIISNRSTNLDSVDAYLRNQLSFIKPCVPT